MLRSATNALVRLLLAPACAACRRPLGRPLDGPVCLSCWTAVVPLRPPWCDRCGDPLAVFGRGRCLCARCEQRAPAFITARSAGYYDGSLREILHAFKYQRCQTLGAPLAELMRAVGSELLEGADAVVPVPLHRWRAWNRGFNQADELARHLALPVWRALRRTLHGPPQASLPAARRSTNVEGAFVARSSHLIAPRWRPRLAGATVVLIDDVMTTGATLDQCSRALLRAGVKTVRALTAARTAAARHRAPPRPLRPPAAPHQ